MRRAARHHDLGRVTTGPGDTLEDAAPVLAAMGIAGRPMLLARLVGRVPGVVSVESSVSWNVDATLDRGRGTQNA